MYYILIFNYEKMKISNIQTIDDVFDLVKETSITENKNNISEKGLKLNEEVGELSAEILKLTGYKYTKDTTQQIRENLLQEASDSIIMIFDILNTLGYTKSEIVESSTSKVDKWLNQIKNKK